MLRVNSGAGVIPPDRHQGVLASTIAVFLIMLAAFASSGIKTSSDSRWSIHTAMSLIRGQGGALTAYAPVLAATDHYAIETCRGEPRTIFPVGVSVLAVPAVAIAALVSPDFEARLAHSVPDSFEKLVASFYGALAVALLVPVVVARVGSVPIAVAVALIFGFGTSMWSTATRALWQHGPLMLMYVVTMVVLERARTRPTALSYVGLPLAAAYVIRPTALVPIAVIGLYVLIRAPSAVPRAILWAIAVLAPWIVYNLVTCGAPYPSYYDPFRLSTTTTFWEALAGNLVSPGRGLLVYSPILLVALVGFIYAVRRTEHRDLALGYGVIVVLHWILVSRFPHWWLGASYGPRVMSDVLPFMVWYLPFAFAAVSDLRGFIRAGAVAGIVLLAGISVAMHAQGATRQYGYLWNAIPLNIDNHPNRVWDWSDPPFLRTRQ